MNDETGLTGAYDFKLTWDETAGPSIVTALQINWGSAWNREKFRVGFRGIDSAQKPSEN